jgi:hypothetical protein
MKRSKMSVPLKDGRKFTANPSPTLLNSQDTYLVMTVPRLTQQRRFSICSAQHLIITLPNGQPTQKLNRSLKISETIDATECLT